MRVCAAIVRDGSILIVRHEHDGEAYWTLPGGGVECSETLQEAVLREVREEVCVEGRVTGHLYTEGDEHCFAVEIPADAQPSLGRDPELPPDRQLLVAVAWRPLRDLRDDVQIARILSAAPVGL